MGAGKTAFIKAICENLGVEDMINSYLFYSQRIFRCGWEYYHMDCYRIEKESEATDIATGYLYSEITASSNGLKN